MNLANTFVKNTLDMDAQVDLKDALRRDSVIIPAILKLLAARLISCKPNMSMLDSPSYPYKRASKDGAQVELEWLVNILTEDKE